MPTVLFVCTANICRSPMAAALFSQQLARRAPDFPSDEWTIRSAGTWAGEGLPAPRNSLEALARQGIDLSAHRSHCLGEADLDAANVVLVMTKGQREAIVAEFPRAAAKVFLLSQTAGPAYDIPDPYGGTKADYEVCADHLRYLIAAGFERILVLAHASPS